MEGDRRRSQAGLRALRRTYIVLGEEGRVHSDSDSKSKSKSKTRACSGEEGGIGASDSCWGVELSSWEQRSDVFLR